MTNETLLLSLRAETLEANLMRLRVHLATTPERLTGLNELAKAAESARQSLFRVRKLRLDLEFLLEGNAALSAKASDTLSAMAADLDRATASLGSMRTAIEQMKTKCFQVAETPVGKDIVGVLSTSTDPVIAKLRGIRALGGTPTSLAERWSVLRDLADSKSEPIFAGYLELLGGAALRDTGFDEKISHFTDELLRSAGRDLLALPMRRQALEKTFERIIRVTFPDWTVWALPSAALEFWNVVGYDKIKNTIDANLANISESEQKSIEKEHWKCLGDAYATYTMGPAYAYYAVGLLLSPDSALHQCRVRAILAMLEEMDKSGFWMDMPYIGVRRQLLDAWNAARAQLGQSVLNFDIDQPEETDEKDPEGVGVRALIRSFRTTLEATTSVKFGVEIWNEIKPWPDHLLANEVAKIDVPNGVEMRHLLNAAWQARVNPARNPKSDLNAAVKELQNMVQECQEKTGK